MSTYNCKIIYFKHLRLGLSSNLLWVFALTLIILFAGGNSYAQTGENVTTSDSFELRVATLEQRYDAQVLQILSNYFDPRSFFVDVDISAEMVDETFTVTQNQVIRQRPNNITMPGLPFLPEENLLPDENVENNPEKILNQNTIRTLKLNSLVINIYADSSLTTRELEFMRLITGIAAKTDDNRGDVINIRRLNMPDFQDDMAQELPQLPQQNNQPEVEKTFAESINDYIPLAVLFVLFLIALVISRIFTRKSSTDQSTIRSQRSNLRSDLTVEGKVKNDQTSNSVILKTIEPDKANEVDLLIQNFFNKPQDISLLFEYWMDEHADQGARRAAQVIASVDRHLIRSLKKDIRPDYYQAISDALDNLPPLSTEERKQIATEFNELLGGNKGESENRQKHSQLNLFRFLDHVSEKVILRLLKTENTQTAALIIDYLDEYRAASILDQLDRDRVADIMLKMATLHNLTYKQHRVISNSLFDKTMELIELEKEERKGTENILPVLEKLPVTQQRQYIEQLQATGSVVAEALKEQFITIEQIPDLDIEIIKHAANELNTGTILEAVAGLEPKILDRILSVRPSREQRLIRLELQENPIKDIKATNPAKSMLMKSIRYYAELHKKGELVKEEN